PTDQVAEAIRSGGLANIKAPRIKNTLHTLTEWQQSQGGSKSLSDFLYDELTRHSPEEAWHYLRSIPGVGPKTAACVLMFDMDLPVMPIDTGTSRCRSSRCTTTPYADALSPGGRCLPS